MSSGPASEHDSADTNLLQQPEAFAAAAQLTDLWSQKITDLGSSLAQTLEVPSLVFNMPSKHWYSQNRLYVARFLKVWSLGHLYQSPIGGRWGLPQAEDSWAPAHPPHESL